MIPTAPTGSGVPLHRDVALDQRRHRSALGGDGGPRATTARSCRRRHRLARRPGPQRGTPAGRPPAEPAARLRAGCEPAGPPTNGPRRREARRGRGPPAGSRRAATVAVMGGRSPAERYSVHRGYVGCRHGPRGPADPGAGGPRCDPDRTLDLVESCDALILSGGNDVDPRLYGQMPGRGKEDPDPERDDVEVSAVRASVSAGRPVLGICRGIQLLAAADGGQPDR